MEASAGGSRCPRCHASLAASERVPEDVRREVGRLGRENASLGGERAARRSGLGKREAKVLALHLARVGPARRKCGGSLRGSGLVRCLQPRLPSERRCDSLNLVW